MDFDQVPFTGHSSCDAYVAAQSRAGVTEPSCTTAATTLVGQGSTQSSSQAPNADEKKAIESNIQKPGSIKFEFNKTFPKKQDRLDFGLFSKIVGPSVKPLQMAFYTFSSNEINQYNNGDQTFYIDGQRKSDACYGGAIQALSKEQRTKIKQLYIKDLSGSIFKSGVGMLSTGNFFYDLLIQTAGEGIGAAISEKPIAPAVTIKAAEKIGGFILAKYTEDWFSDKTVSVLLDLSFNTIEKTLNDEGVLAWNLSGNNYNLPDRDQAVVPFEFAEAKARLYYNPWNHYTTVIIYATCKPSLDSSKNAQKLYVVTYENEKEGIGAFPKNATEKRRFMD